MEHVAFICPHRRVRSSAILCAIAVLRRARALHPNASAMPYLNVHVVDQGHQMAVRVRIFQEFRRQAADRAPKSETMIHTIWASL